MSLPPCTPIGSPRTHLPPAAPDAALPPACWDCLGLDPATATDLTLRVNPITSDPCPDLLSHRGAEPQVPHACDACIRENPAAQFNIRFRYRVIDGEHQGRPDRHPYRFLSRQALTGTDAKVSVGWPSPNNSVRKDSKAAPLPR